MTCGVIDVLRATSTIVTALGNGCGGIFPCATPDLAREKAAALRAEHGFENVLLGGELDAKPLEGFDGGNSPLEYTRERIEGRFLVLSTSNGTKTLAAAGSCSRVFIVSFANITAAARRLAKEVQDENHCALLIACSGREGGYCGEDTATAGFVLSGVKDILREENMEFSDSAIASIRVAEKIGKDYSRMLRESWWGKHLASLGLEEDIDFCGRCDWTDIVPQMKDGVITAP